MTEVLISEIYKADDEVVRITREDRGDGRMRLHIREWFSDANQEWRPGRAGITIKREQVHPIVAGILNAASDRGRR